MRWGKISEVVGTQARRRPVVALALLSLAPQLFSQSSNDLAVRVVPPEREGMAGDSVTVSVVFDFGVGAISGWQVSLCMADPFVAVPTAVEHGSICADLYFATYQFAEGAVLQGA